MDSSKDNDDSTTKVNLVSGSVISLQPRYNLSMEEIKFIIRQRREAYMVNSTTPPISADSSLVSLDGDSTEYSLGTLSNEERKAIIRNRINAYMSDRREKLNILYENHRLGRNFDTRRKRRVHKSDQKKPTTKVAYDGDVHKAAVARRGTKHRPYTKSEIRQLARSGDWDYQRY